MFILYYISFIYYTHKDAYNIHISDGQIQIAIRFNRDSIAFQDSISTFLIRFRTLKIRLGFDSNF